MQDRGVPQVGLKIDVCNRRALDRGVPGMLALLAEQGIQASFFVTFGPDHSGRALRRLFRPGFLRKMVRTRAPRMYGLRTLFYGTLLPGPPVGEAAPELLRRIEGEGHEVGIHGFDHVGWHDGLMRMDEEQVRSSLSRAAERFGHALGHPPRFSGAPGWQVSATSLRVQETLGLDFASDARGPAPFVPAVDGQALRTLQVPTTHPTSDEVLGAGEADASGLCAYYLGRLRGAGPHVLGLHAEAEGIHLSAWLGDLLTALKQRGARFRTLSQLAHQARPRACIRSLELRRIPGRADPVACPGEPAPPADEAPGTA